MDPNEYDKLQSKLFASLQKRQSGSSLSCGWNHSCALFFPISKGESSRYLLPW